MCYIGKYFFGCVKGIYIFVKCVNQAKDPSNLSLPRPSLKPLSIPTLHRLLSSRRPSTASSPAASPPPPPHQPPALHRLLSSRLHRLLSSRLHRLLSSRLHCLLSSCRPSTASSQAVVSPPHSPAAVSLHPSLHPSLQPCLSAVSLHPSLQPPSLSTAPSLQPPVPPSAIVTSLTARCSTKIKNLDNNIGSVRVKLSEDIKEISEAVPINEVAGDITFQSWPSCSWKSADTPPKAAHE
ncbi:hypothetical protein Scep_011980 [Stephania cephalantha]|uniref:Uncharacterized protein n=1 Tax=Stephania cephalantha TaxID=152367 RepID=A0AAP0JGE3_9MAGN